LLQLALCYKQGKGIGSDKREAVYWFRQAAAQGHTVAQAFLQGPPPSSNVVIKHDAESEFCHRRISVLTDTTWQLNQQNICAWE
jgi:hypothetical protein